MEDQKKEVTPEEGPLSLLKDAFKKNSQILIYSRNNRKILSRIRAFDRYMSIELENVIELWTETGKGKKATHKNRGRFINKLFLRGDSVMLVLKNSKEKA
jgi:small nuclear ribonucleoprotein D2